MLRIRPMSIIVDITAIASCVIACGIAEPYAKSFKDRITAKFKAKKEEKEKNKKEEEAKKWNETAKNIHINQMSIGS